MPVGFLSLRTSGPDPASHAFLSAERLAPDASGRFVVAGAEPGSDPAEALRELIEASKVSLLIVPEHDIFEAWTRALQVDAPPAFGLEQLSAFLRPGDRGRTAELCRRLCAVERIEELDATGLHRVTRALICDLHGHGDAAFAVLGRAWTNAQERLQTEDPEASLRLALLAQLIDRPSGWAQAGEALFTESSDLRDGRFGEAVASLGDVELGLDEIRPRWGIDHFEAASRVPPTRDGTLPLQAADRELVREMLSVHLPELGDRPHSAGAPLHERPSQVAVACEVAKNLGSGELLLMHAPTGTGKTLAYLVPALLFALRNDLRVGVATYTRALQTQGYERDVPIALDLLRRAGIEDLPRVALLKGRQNYLCWRALTAGVPQPDDTGARWLAWAGLLAFALSSPDGDLDQLPRERAFAVLRAPAAGLELERLVRTVAARSGCCSKGRSRGSCAAETARRRAECSHLVITNHAFVLARRDFFKHVVFDECEHLHDQAHSAFSSTVELRVAMDLIEGLHPLSAGKSKRTRRGRRPLERVGRAAVPGTRAEELVRIAKGHQRNALKAFTALERALREFERWRRTQARGRQEKDAHSLMREFVEGRPDDALPGGAERDPSALIAAQLDALRATGGAEVALAAIAEELDSVPLNSRDRVRALLERQRVELSELNEALGAWLPMHDGAPKFASEVFYDAEEHPRRGWTLAARVLLPNEVLGRHYYPDLASGVLISATTHLAGGFDAAARYLGLDRAVEPAEDENRVGCTLVTMQSPEAFDYSRVLVAIPNDGPDYRAGKQAWLEYTATFIQRTALMTGGRLVALFTNANDCAEVGRRLAATLEPRGIQTLYQGLPGLSSERLADRFRARRASVLLGLDTFWFGADFPGEALEYLVIAKLPYGAPDRYHHAQCAAIGSSEQRRRIYMPRALARFRQGFGRLMRSASDRGAVFVLDARALEPRHKRFLGELPIETPETAGARMLRAPTEDCIRSALAHMDRPMDYAPPGTPASDAPVLDDETSPWAHEGSSVVNEPDPWIPPQSQKTETWEGDTPF